MDLGRGGALSNYYGTTTLSDCTLSSNHADTVRPFTTPPSPAASCDDHPTAPLSSPSLTKPLR